MKKFFQIFSNCIPVKGYMRSIIYDLQKISYRIIPNTLFKILENSKASSLDNIYNAFDKEDRAVLDEYFEFLINNEFGFYCSEQERDHFPDLDLSWDNPGIITNCILDYSQFNAIYIKNIINELDILGCKDIQIRLFQSTAENEFIERILEEVKNTRIKAVDFILEFHKEQSLAKLDELCENNGRIRTIILYNHPENRIYRQPVKRMRSIVFSNDKLENQYNDCGKISMNYFYINTIFFTEAQHHNTCLNRKVCIDVNGEIKNCPSMQKSYGNIKDTTLQEAIEKPGFKDYWFINKDRIDVCKDCEFRYMCTDCRAFIKNSDDLFSQPAKCTYNPYIAKWQGEEGYITVEEWREQQIAAENKPDSTGFRG